MAGLLSRFSSATKAFRMVWSRSGGDGWGSFNKLTDPWWERAGVAAPSDIPAAVAEHPERNSAVTICLGWIADNFPEPVLEVAEPKADGTWNAVPAHPLTQLLDAPNEIDDADGLWAATVMSYCVDGNAYWIKVRTRGGALLALEYVPHWSIRPASRDRYRPITHYVYTVDGERIELAPAEVVHFRFGKDPDNPRLGCSRLKHLLMEIASDHQATLYTAAILHKMGVVGGILTNEDDEVTMTPEKAEKIRQHYREMFTGANAGNLMIPTFKARYQETGRSPEEMALDKIRQVPEDRICAALRVPIMVAGLTGGSAHKTYANYEEARQAAYEDCLMPLQRRMARTLTRFLLPDFERDARRQVRWNYDGVRVLQADLDALSKRTVEEYKGGLIRLNEAREKVGEKALPGPEGEQFYQKAPKPGALGEPPESGSDRAAANGRVPALAGANGNGRKSTGDADAFRAAYQERIRERRRQSAPDEEAEPEEAAGDDPDA